MTLKVLICIPTYNNAGTIGRVVSQVLKSTTLSVLVVDDGSDVPVAQNLADSEIRNALASGRLTVVRREINQGKGAALQRAIGWAVRNGFTHLLSMDGDGQHLPEEIQKLLREAIEHPWSLIIGKRHFERAVDVPKVSKFGRGFSNFWVGYQTGQSIADSQSGFRLYPLFHVQNWRFWTRKYDFEIEVLIRLLWKGVEVREVGIEVYYPPVTERVSHFDKFWDNVRISTLNTVLVVVSLLRQNLSPVRAGGAMGLGVFIGCSPLFGLHALLAAAVAFFGRLNAVLLLVGTQVSIPPLAMILIPLEIWLGHRLLGAGRLADWIIGWLVLGGALGLVSGFLTWVIFRQKQRGRNWTGRTRGGRIGNGFLRLVMKSMGRNVGDVLLVFIAPYFYLFAPRARRSGNEFWRLVDPGLNWWQRQIRVMKQMFTFGQVLMDRGYLAIKPGAGFEALPCTPNHILNPIRKGEPLILLSGHVGSWDLAAVFLCKEGIRGPFHMVHYQSPDLTFEKVIGQSVAHRKVNSVLITDQPVLRIKQYLDSGQPVGFMADRPSKGSVELVPFLGRLLPIDIRAFRIAAACQASIAVAFAFRSTAGRYDLHTFEPFRIKPGAKATSVREGAIEYARTLEKVIVRYPRQWFNFFPTFSSQPEPPPGASAGREQNYLLQEWPRPANSESAPGVDSKLTDAQESP